MNKSNINNLIETLSTEAKEIEGYLAEITARIMNAEIDLRDIELAEHGLTHMQPFIITEEFMKLEHISDSHWQLGECGYVRAMSSESTCYVAGKSKHDDELVSHGQGMIPVDIIISSIRRTPCPKT